MNHLLIPDLFYCVLDCIGPNSGPTILDDRKTLAALAQTCRAFSEPCLDRLWRYLDSLLPLVQSFASVVDEARVKTYPSPHEWLIINRYSYRIIELTLGTEPLSLEFLQCTKLALPGLRILRWGSPGKPVFGHRETFPLYSIAYLRPLLTSKIIILEVKLDADKDPKFHSFLRKFSRLCPNLMSIRFDFFSRTGQVPLASRQTLSRAICDLRSLQDVILSCPLTDNAVKHLGMSSTLKGASLILDFETTGQIKTCFRRTDIPFDSVSALALTLWNRLDFAMHTLRAHGQAFQSLGVTLVDTQVTTMEIFSLFTAIASPRRARSLDSLAIGWLPNTSSDGIPIESASEMEELPYNTFSPIASLVHLRYLILQLNHPIAINDEEFASLVHNRPELEALCLTGCYSEHPTKSITLNGLLSLVASCPKLREISLTLDARQVPPNDVVRDVCSSSVTFLSFCDSPIDHPELVEAFLLKHLPRAYPVPVMFMSGREEVRRKYMELWVQANLCRAKRSEVGV